MTPFSLTWLFTDFDVITEYRFPLGICNGCGMPTADAYSSGPLVLSHFGTCMCSNVETILSWTCLVSGLLNFGHPSVLLFCFLWSFVEFCSLVSEKKPKMSQPIRGWGGHLVFPIGPKNTNLVEDVEILHPVKFRWIPFSGFRKEVENVKVYGRRRTDGWTTDGALWQ